MLFHNLFCLSHKEIKISYMVLRGGDTAHSKINPSRYYDFFFSSIGLLCGGIPIFQGWRLDPILLLSQMLLSGTAIFFIAESLYLRTVENDITKSSFRKKYKFSHKRKEFFNFGNKSIYRNFELRMRKRSPYKKWEGIYYTTHIPYGNRKKHEKRIEL